MRTTKNLVFAAVVGMSGALFGCAANNASLKPEEFSAAFEQSTKAVDTLLQQGNQKDAFKMLDELAAKNPERKEPWARKARIHFDAGNYAQAITSAEEVLQRDSLLDLLARFLHLDVEEKTADDGRKLRKENLIFPRYHQLQAVRRMVAEIGRAHV